MSLVAKAAFKAIDEVAAADEAVERQLEKWDPGFLPPSPLGMSRNSGFVWVRKKVDSLRRLRAGRSTSGARAEDSVPLGLKVARRGWLGSKSLKTFLGTF